MSIDVGALAQTILGAFETSFKNNWLQVRDYAVGEAKKLGVSLAQITTMYAAGKISQGEAAVLLEMQKNATRAVLLAIEGMGLIAVEEAINAAMGAVKDVVNKTIGFPLIV